MTKYLLTTAAVALVAATGAVQAENAKTERPGIGTAISGTANAAYQKAAEGVNSVRKDYHEGMANSNAKAARENLAEGNFGAAAEDAKDAATHQADAAAAAHDAAVNKDKASKSWGKAKEATK